MNPLWTAVLFALIDITPKLIDLFNNLTNVAEKTGEWTPEQAASFRARMEAALAAAHWQKRGE